MQIKTKYLIIAPEGWGQLIFLGLLTVVSYVFFPIFVSALLTALFLFALQFYRDPPRRDQSNVCDILSPADGRIVKIESTIDPYTGNPAILVSVFMNVFNVHSNRRSASGVVKKVQYFPGKFINASFDKASTDNERNVVCLEVNYKNTTYPLTLVQIAGLIARRISCYVKPEQSVVKGERYGFIQFGSRVDVYLPPNVEIMVFPGEKVNATRTVLARWQA